jgi:Xaa-Pro aminopeptidase
MLDVNCCRQRQRRLVEVLQQQKLDAAVCGLDRHVYYFTGYRPLWMHHAAAVIFTDGHTWLTTPNEPAGDAAADAVDAFVAQHMATLR